MTDYNERLPYDLASGLAISYNGQFLQDCPKERSSAVGTILTRKGQVHVRDSEDECWDNVITPTTFYFYDNQWEVTFLVDGHKKSITEVKPEGKILDCTDRVIYEIRDSTWCAVCDLSDKAVRTIVKCTHLNACEERFDVLGNNPVLLPELSEISAEDVNLANGSLNPAVIEPGHCAVLIYKTCLCDEKVIVAHIFIRDAETIRFSASCGQFAPLVSVPVTPIAVPFEDPSCPPATSVGCLTPILPGAINLVPIVNWVEQYDIPGGFDPATGCYTSPQTGDYQVNAILSYCSPLALPLTLEVSVPWYALIRFPAGTNPATTPGMIAFCAPVAKNEQAALDIADRIEISQAAINVGLRLNAGDRLCIYYVDEVASTLATITNPGPPVVLSPGGYRLILNCTAFNAHFLGCAPVTPFPTPL